jgi:hypothetical protein
MKLMIAGMIALMMVFASGCASDGSTAVTIYDKEGNKVQEETTAGIMIKQAYEMAKICENAKATVSKNANLGIIQADGLAKLAPSAQTEYMRTLPMLHMSSALRAATQKEIGSCQAGIVAYYNHLNVAKRENASLWRKLIGIGGFIGGAYVIGNSVTDIVSSIAGTGGSTYNVSGSRANFDSGNNQTNSSVSSSGDGLGANNTFPRNNSDSVIYGGNQPRGTATDFQDQNGQIDFGSNSGDNAPQGLLEIPEVPVE